MRRNTNRILIGGFLALLLIPTLAALFRFEPMKELFERRALAPRPLWDTVKVDEPTTVATYAQGWENYYNDHFGLRKFLIGTYRVALMHFLKLSANPGVVIGQSDGQSPWLFYEGAFAGDGLGLDSYLGKMPFSIGELATIRANLANLAQLATNNNQKFLVVVCPDKHSIYPEYLPKKFQPASGVNSRLEQMSKTVQEVLGSHYLDLRQPLWQAKHIFPVYLRTDTHWNAKGAFVGYTAIMKALQIQDPTRVPLPSHEVAWVSHPPGHGDLVGLLGVPAFPRESSWATVLPKPEAYPIRKQGKLLVIHDSFFDALKPLFEFEFQQVKTIRGIQMSSGTILTQELITAEKPDVIIIESVERIWTR